MESTGIHIEPPHVVLTCAACAHCLKLSQEQSGHLRCGACGMAGYCSRECQVANFPAHKSYCKALKLFKKLNEGLPENILPKTAMEFYIQRMNTRSMLEPMLRRPLSRVEARAIIGEAKCAVCMRTREQLPSDSGLMCCLKCHWGWACQEHQKAYWAGPHCQVCSEYKMMNDAQLHEQELVKRTGKVPSYALPALEFQLPGEMPAEGWTHYPFWRRMPEMEPYKLALFSKKNSLPLTVLLGLQKVYGSIESLVSTLGPCLTVHVLGASALEVPPDPCWEELLHLVPGCTCLRVAFVGPELEAMIEEQDNGKVHPKPNCQLCTSRGCSRLFSYHFSTYHHFLEKYRSDSTEEGASRPDITVAFNSGISEVDIESWRPTLDVLIDQGAPAVWTSYTQEECHADAGVWKAAGGTVLLEPIRNPYRSLEPIKEPSKEDDFYYHNNYFFIGRGQGSNGL